MKFINIALLLIVGGMSSSVMAKTLSPEEKLYRAAQAEEQQDRSDSEKKSAAFNKAVNEKIVRILKYNHDMLKTKATFKKAVLAWSAYQKAMCEAVEVSYLEAGGHGGGQAEVHCNLMVGEDLLKGV